MALTQISTAGVKDDAVTSGKIPADAVGSSEIAANAVGASELANDAVDTAAIVNQAVTAAKIADSTITDSKLVGGTITNASISNTTITRGKMANNSVGTTEILDDAITTAKVADQAITGVKIANGTITQLDLADGAVVGAKIADGAIVTTKIPDDAVTAAKIGAGACGTEQLADQAVTLAKLPHGTSSNDGKFLRANNGADPSFETVTGTTINSQSNNRLITCTSTSNTLDAEESLLFEKVNGADPTFTFKRTSSASGNDNIYAEIRAQNDQGTNMGQLIWRRESSAGNSYLDFETKMDGENSQPSMRIKGQQGTAYFVGNLGRTNDNQPAYMSDLDYYSNTHLSTVNIQTRTNGGECGLFVRGRGQGGGSSSPHSCIRVDATNCANNADQYGIYIKGRQQLVSDTTGIYADVYGSYSTTYVYRAHLQKQIGAYTTGTSFHSKITQTSSGGASYHFRGYNGSSERIRIDLGGNITNTNNSYGSLSDVKLKENIVDAKSQWDDIKALKVRNFNFKDDTDKVKMLGLVAQEAEAVSAGLVETENDIEVDEKTGKGKLVGTTKVVKYSILYMKAIKALQEAMARIEVLEAKVA